MLQFMGSQRGRRNLATKQQQQQGNMQWKDAQGAPRDPRRDSRRERSPWLPLETRPDSPGAGKFRVLDTQAGLPWWLTLGLSLGSPIFPSGCKGKLGVALESLQGRRDLT